MMRLTTTFFLVFINLSLSLSQINYSIKDGIELLISNPRFIESSLNYEGYKYASTEANKFNKYIHKDNKILDFVYTYINDRIEVISWSSILNSKNYNSFQNEIKKLDFIEASEKISNYTDFNSSSQQFVNLEMNCVISLIEARYKNTINIIIGRKDNNKPLKIPDGFTIFNGTKIFTDGLEGWNIKASIINNKISITSYPHSNNEFFKNEKYNPYTLNGYIKNGIIYTTINEEGATEIHPSIFKFFKNKLYSANNENGYNEYKILDNTIEDDIFESVEIQPEPPNGITEFRKWINDNYQYPKEAIHAGVKGTIQISFVVEKDGSLTNLKVLRDLSYETGQAAINLLKESKKWRPGIQNGRPVRVKYHLPIRVDTTNL